MSEARSIMLNDIRYAERLCARTARLYRRVQAAGTWATVVSGSAVLSLLSSQVPPAVAIAGACCATVFGAALVAIRPADKAAANEVDVKRYAKLRSEAHGMDDAQLRAALDRAHEPDAPEVEGLREVAFNDVVREIGRTDQLVPLRFGQKVLAALA